LEHCFVGEAEPPLEKMATFRKSKATLE